MEKEKKQFTISDYIIVIVGFLTMVALVVFWSTPAHAETKSFKYNDKKYTIDVSDSLLESKPYIYTTIDKDGTICVYLSSAKLYSNPSGSALLNIYDSSIAWSLYRIYSGTSVVINDSTTRYNYGTWSKSINSNGSGSSCIFTSGFAYSNTNINYVSDYDEEKGYTVKSDSFFIPSAVPSIQMVEELPAMVQSQTEVILIVAVSCLALLIGSLALLPKLRRFLV